MRWRGRRQSSNVEDRRGGGGGGGLSFPRSRGRIARPSRASGGLGLGGIVLILIVSWVLGINPLTLLSGGGGSIAPQQTQFNQPSAGGGTDDEMKQFVSTVLADTEDIWHAIFEAAGARYREPSLVLFTDRVQSACGFASSATGPFYCPGDEKVYIDLGFYRELHTRFEAPGDYAQAYVLAHEVGHHVQNLIGVLPKFNQMRRQLSEIERNRMSTRVELQADCFAGIWGYHTREQGWIEQGDLVEAMNAASQIGDDAIQKRMQGYVVPESFNHGTSEQRQRWFKTGFDTGSMEACDTFNAAQL
ncbi:MAG: neutral zinc metallopeptidase [Pseudomonadota bacterium]